MLIKALCATRGHSPNRTPSSRSKAEPFPPWLQWTQGKAECSPRAQAREGVIALRFSLLMLHRDSMSESSLPFSPHTPPTSLKGGDESCLQVSTRGTARVGGRGGDRAAWKGESL